MLPPASDRMESLWTTPHLPHPAAVARLAEALAARNIEMIPVATKAEALAKIKELIPAGATVMNGSSLTLEQIGYTEFAASAESPWVNLHKATALEEDPLKRVALRREASISDYYLGSVSAVTEAGELVIASGSGSQIPGASYNGTHVIFVVGAQRWCRRWRARCAACTSTCSRLRTRR